MESQENIKLLDIAKFHLSKQKAKKYVESLASSLEIPIPEPSKYKNTISVLFSGKTYTCSFAQSVEETRLNGVPKSVQFIFDSRDQFLQPIINMALHNLPKGLNATISATLGSYKKSIQAPGMIESPEQSLADDILYYRRETCDCSTLDNLEKITRFYRSYLQACISLVDCFLFRYTFFIKEKIGNLNEYANTNVLGSITGIEKRIEAWIQTFAYHKIDEYNKTEEWSKFQELKRERNKFIHPLEPAATYTPKEMVKYLNYCQKGIGGLLENFRVYSEHDPRMGFIQKIKTAPNAFICK